MTRRLPELSAAGVLPESPAALPTRRARWSRADGNRYGPSTDGAGAPRRDPAAVRAVPADAGRRAPHH